MATSNANYAFHNSSSQRAVAMMLALVSALVLSPLYIDRRRSEYKYETKWSSGFVLPVVLAGLIVAIKTTSSASTSQQRGTRASPFPSSSEPSSVSVHKIGGSSWGLASILVMLVCVLSWQSSVQHFFWR
ncbi:hypothetical protein ACH5RR_024333 [Cinchona calisaya]|uniref:Uncharacterized protein n=1 Tax=Cinchona calisaya TaxID=153742 RepID=A0ABD2YYG4_9GENT